MGRKSKLTDKQWAEIEQRNLNGEGMRALSREFNVTESAIRQRISAQNKQIKTLAQKKAKITQEIRALPVSAQTQVSILADELMAMQINLASAGKYGSIVARHSMSLAAKQIEKVDQSDPMESAEILQGVAGLARIANEASTIGLNLMKKNDSTIEEKTKDQQQPKRVVIVGGQRRN